MDVSEIVPISVWEKILKDANISGFDVLSICSCCKRFHDFLYSNSTVWREKVFQRWPTLKKQLEKVQINDWFEIYRQRHIVISEAKKMLDDLAAKYLHEEKMHLSDSAFQIMDDYASRDEYRRLFLIDELRFILNETPANVRLTDKYYAKSALRYLVQQSQISRWRQWLEGGQQLESGAWLFAQWFSQASYLNESLLTRLLYKMASDARSKLSEINRHHSLIRQSEIVHPNIRESMWSPSETRQVIDALNFVFSVLHGFRGNVDDYYSLKNSFLNEVIQSKLGIPITLCILYHAVARRLGVYCAPVNFPSHFLLKFLDNPELKDSEKYTYIDVFNSCRLMREDQVWATYISPITTPRDQHFFDIPNSVSVLSRMINNVARVDEQYHPIDWMVICSGLELAVVLKPTEFDMRYLLAKIYFRLDFNLEKIIPLMEDVGEPELPAQRVQRQHYLEMARAKLLETAAFANDDVTKPKLRSEHGHVKHAVGMIMRHKEYHYTCVITSWDPICAAATSWKTHMGVQNLSRKDQQPFYHVLVNDGSNRYAAEENLVFEPNPAPITHQEVGKYFQEFCGTFYKMNSQHVVDYPEDDRAVLQYVQHAYLEKTED